MKSLNAIGEELYATTENDPQESATTVEATEETPNKADAIVNEAIEAINEYDKANENWWRVKLPSSELYDEVDEYGFYEYKNKYFMRRMKKDQVDYVPVSNFTMRVLFLIKSSNPKRIVEITNVKGKTVTIDFTIDELISLDKFKFKVESQGNFLFSGTASDIMRIKQKLFDEEKASAEVSFAGHHRDGFYTFSNGVYDYKNHHFIPLNEHKMVDLEGNHYFIPLLEGNEDEEENANFKAFQHRTTTHT